MISIHSINGALYQIELYLRNPTDKNVTYCFNISTITCKITKCSNTLFYIIKKHTTVEISDKCDVKSKKVSYQCNHALNMK